LNNSLINKIPIKFKSICKHWYPMCDLLENFWLFCYKFFLQISIRKNSFSLSKWCSLTLWYFLDNWNTIVFKSFSNHFQIIFSNHFQIIFKSFSNHFQIIFKSFSNQLHHCLKRPIKIDTTSGKVEMFLTVNVVVVYVAVKVFEFWSETMLHHLH